MRSRYYSDMESLKFTMYYDPNLVQYRFKSYPGFVNDKYVSTDFTTNDGVVDKFILDSHKKQLFYSSKLRDELLHELEKGPEECFHLLDARLHQGYKQYKSTYQTWLVYKKTASLYAPTEEIKEAGNSIFSKIHENIMRVETDTCDSIQTYAHHIAQALLARQPVYLGSM